MVTETIVETPTQADPGQSSEPQTETPVAAPPEEAPAESVAAESEDAAAAPEPVKIEEPQKPDYVTRDELERRDAEVASRAAAQALDSEKRKRQTENARRARAEEMFRLDQQEALDTIRATFVARGLDPDAVTEDLVVRAVDRLAAKKVNGMNLLASERVAEVWDYLAHPLFKRPDEPAMELSDDLSDMARAFAPRMQAFVDTYRDIVTKQARVGYISESELPKRVEDAIALREAKSRTGKTELARVEGSASNIDRSLEAVTNRIISNDADEVDKELWNNRFGTKR